VTTSLYCRKFRVRCDNREYFECPECVEHQEGRCPGCTMNVCAEKYEGSWEGLLRELRKGEKTHQMGLEDRFDLHAKVR